MPNNKVTKPKSQEEQMLDFLDRYKQRSIPSLGDGRVAIGARVGGEAGEVVGIPNEGFNELGQPMGSRPALPPIVMGAQRPFNPQSSANLPSKGNNFMENFRWFSRPGQIGALEALGSGLAGFASPFTGTSWTPPKADTTGLEFMRWMMKEQLKDPARKRALDIKLRKAAQVEAARQIKMNPQYFPGGFPAKGAEEAYKTLSEKLYQEALKKYGVGKTLDETNEEDIDDTDYSDLW